MKKYYCMAIELQYADAMINLKVAVSNMVELYVLLSECESHNDMITAELISLRTSKSVNNYINTINFAEKYDIRVECPICYENDCLGLIVGECMHLVCRDCYMKISKCPYCET